MKSISAVSRSIITFLLMALAFQSCVKDNTDDCGNRVRIVVRTIAEETGTGDNGPIDNVLIYIFDHAQRFVGTWQGGAYTYGQEYAASQDLSPGIYHFVVWTNQMTSYAPSGDPANTNDLVVSLQYSPDKKVTTDIPELHYGMLSQAEVVDNQDNEFLVIIRPNTYKLNFTVEGLPADANDYSFTVRDNNTHYSFDNSIIDGMDEIEYIRTTGFTGDRILSSMNVLRLMDDREPLFDLRDITLNENMYRDNLVQMIKKAYSTSGRTVDFDTEFEFDIILRFDAQLGVTVSVNGWGYSGNETEL